MRYNPTAAAISRLISELYARNPDDGRARWLYRAWVRFSGSAFYALTPDTASYGALQSFARAAFVLRRLVRNKPAAGDVDVSLPGLAAETLDRTWQEMSSAAAAALEAAQDFAAAAAKRAVLPIGVVLFGVYLWNRANK